MFSSTVKSAIGAVKTELPLKSGLLENKVNDRVIFELILDRRA